VNYHRQERSEYLYSEDNPVGKYCHKCRNESEM